MNSAQSYQPSLFDPPAAKTPAVVLDINQGRILREQGIEKAILHADQENADWSGRALELLKKFLVDQHSPFMTEDFRKYSELIDFPQPPNARAYGGVIAKAARQKLIERVGIRQVKNKNAHCANAAVWIKKVLI